MIKIKQKLLKIQNSENTIPQYPYFYSNYKVT